MWRLTLIFVVLQIVGSLSGIVEDPQNSAALRAVVEDGCEYSKEFYKASTKAIPGNLISSPISASTVLSMLTYGARGSTETALKSALHFNKDDNIQRKGLKTLLEELNDTPGVELRLANKIFKSNSLVLKSEYEQLVDEIFKSKIEGINFLASKEAAKTINDWCEQQTDGKIKDVVSEDTLSADTAVVLVNAVYFKGKWAPFFKKDRTRDAPFYLEDGRTVKNISTMHTSNWYRLGFLKDIDARFAELPYEGGQVSMFIILPNRVDGLRNIQQNFAQVNLSRLLTTGYSTKLQLTLPKFEIETEIDLQQPLTDLGMGEIFKDSADLSGMFDIPVRISKAVQKAYIKVDEEGTEAAAVTHADGLIVSGYVPEFTVNRPFYYAIIKRVGDSGIVLFQGHFKNPN